MVAAAVVASFTWRDGERLVRFGRGVAHEALELAGGPGFLLLSTRRAVESVPALADAAAEVHTVPAGRVDVLAAELLEEVPHERIVALGGGRVIDVAKALAAAWGSRQLAAVPTTLSGAELSARHRHARGVDPATPHVRPGVVVADPELTASLPLAPLAASAANALGHAAEAPCTRRANPVATLAAHDGARRLLAAFARAHGPDGTGAGEPDRDGLALGALLAGYALGSAGLGLHHVLAQGLAPLAGHGPANAVMLPHTLRALAWRFPHEHAALAEVLGEDPPDAAERLARIAGTVRLRDLDVSPDALRDAADAAAEREDLDATPPRADRAEILALYEAAW